MKNASLGIILNKKKDEVLLVKRKDVPVWVLPGGGIDPGETPEEALKREIHEETGLQINILRKLAEFHPMNSLASLTFLFECEGQKGILAPSEETQEVEFFSLSSLPPNFFYLHHQWVLETLSSSKTPIVRNLSEVNYSALIRYFLIHPLQVLRFLITKIQSH